MEIQDASVYCPWRFLLFVVATLAFLHFCLPSTADAASNETTSNYLPRVWLLEESNDHRLALGRTKRPDPLNKLKQYQGGWNITNKHYWASVALTGWPAFAVGILWFIAFGITLVGLLCYHCCCRRTIRVKLHNKAYTISIILLLLFTCAGIAGSVLLYRGKEKFHHSISVTQNYVNDQAHVVVNNLKIITGYLGLAKTASAGQMLLSDRDKELIDGMTKKIQSASTRLASDTYVNLDAIKTFLNIVHYLLVVIAAIMLALAFLGLILSVLGRKHLIYVVVLFAWVFVTATFILCGVFVCIKNVVGDTCFAMEDWVERPSAKTSLDKILPCVDVNTARESLNQSNAVARDMVNVSNLIIANIANMDLPPRLNPSLINNSTLYYNQSGPHVPTLCYPYASQTVNRSCNDTEVTLEDAQKVWKNYTCRVDSSGFCQTPGRLTPNMYKQLISASNITYGLYRYTPFLVNLVDCTFVKDTFSTINSEYCPDLRYNLKLVYMGLGFVSSAILLSIVFWVLYGEQRRNRKLYYEQHEARLNKQISVSVYQKQSHPEGTRRAQN